MNKLLVAALLFFAASPTFAQVFQPIEVESAGSQTGQATGPRQTTGAITIQADRFKFDIPGGPSSTVKTNGLFAGDFTSPSGHGSGAFVYGFWFADDKQNIYETQKDFDSSGVLFATIPVTATESDQFTELHGGYAFNERQNSSLGATIGYLGLRQHYNLQAPNGASGSDVTTDTDQWLELNLVGSTTPEDKANKAGRFTLGYSVGILAGERSTEKQDLSGFFASGTPLDHASASGDERSGYSYGLSAAYALTPAFTLNAALWNMSLDFGSKIYRYSAGIGYRF